MASNGTREAIDGMSRAALGALPSTPVAFLSAGVHVLEGIRDRVHATIMPPTRTSARKRNANRSASPSKETTKKPPNAPPIPAPKIALVVKKSMPTDLKPTVANSTPFKLIAEKAKEAGVKDLSATFCQPKLLVVIKRLSRGMLATIGKHIQLWKVHNFSAHTAIPLSEDG